MINGRIDDMRHAGRRIAERSFCPAAVFGSHKTRPQLAGLHLDDRHVGEVVSEQDRPRETR